MHPALNLLESIYAFYTILPTFYSTKIHVWQINADGIKVRRHKKKWGKLVCAYALKDPVRLRITIQKLLDSRWTPQRLDRCNWREAYRKRCLVIKKRCCHINYIFVNQKVGEFVIEVTIIITWSRNKVCDFINLILQVTKNC